MKKEELLKNVSVFYHSSIRLSGSMVVYADPYEMEEEAHDADVILITHDHYDHFSEKDIEKLRKENTILVVPESMYDKAVATGWNVKKIKKVIPGSIYEFAGILLEVVPAYTKNKSTHPKAKKWVGYVVTINDLRYYIAGDTDLTAESMKVKCDVALVPVGGTYTMDYKDAAKLINTIKPQLAIPVHFGAVVGSMKDAEGFVERVDKKNIQTAVITKKVEASRD